MPFIIAIVFIASIAALVAWQVSKRMGQRLCRQCGRPVDRSDNHCRACGREVPG
jgi:predicted amidophosphoribosyltransferase